MKKFSTLIIALFWVNLSTNVFAQCDTPPVWDGALIPDITLNSSDGIYCPNMGADPDVSDSGDPETLGAVSSGNAGLADCDIVNLFALTYVDASDNGDCMEIITRTWTATYDDGDGQTADYDQTITIADDIAPTIVAPDDVTITGCDENDPNVAGDTGFAFDAGPAMVSEADFTGNGSGASVMDDCAIMDISYEDTYAPLGCPDPIGTITRIWTVTDACGNANTDEQLIALEDLEVPTITCPPDAVVNLTDACDETDSSIALESGFPYSAAQLQVMIDDFTGAPVNGDFTDNCTGNMRPSYIDGPVTVTPGACASGDPFITFERTWVIADACGNLSDPCVQIINVFDNSPPVLESTPPDFDAGADLQACDENDPNIETVTGFPFDAGPAIVDVASFGAAGGMVREECDPPYPIVVSYSDAYTPIPGNCPDHHGEIIRSWTITDECGNETMHDQQILMFDSQPPVIASCPTPDPLMISVLNGEACDQNNAEIEGQTGYPFSAGPVTIPGTDFPGSATDNCNNGEIFEAMYMDEIQSQGCTGGANISMEFFRTWTVTDLCGNTAECIQTIQLIDTEVPFFPDYDGSEADFFYEQDEDNENGPFTYVSPNCTPAVVMWTPPTPGVYDDNCTMAGNITVTNTHNPGDEFAANTGTTVEYTFTDECGNVLIVQFVITVTCGDCGGGVIYESCDDPPTLCDLTDIDAFASCTPVYGGSVLDNLCSGFVVNNPAYFEFIAGEETLDLTVTPSDCLNGAGIQAVVIEPCNPGNCFTSFGGQCFLNPTTITAEGLTIGNIYQLIVDGCGGDECNWTVEISTVPFQIPDVEDQEQIAVLPSFSGCDTEDLIFCQGTEISFFPSDLEEAEYYFCWSVSNLSGVSAVNSEDDCEEFVAPTPSGLNYSCGADFSSCGPITLAFADVGTFEICLAELENGCDNEMPGTYCWEIQVIENGIIDFGRHLVCEEDLPWDPSVIDGPNGESWTGGAIDQAGIATAPFSDDCGCDFTYQVDLQILPLVKEFVELNLCANELDNWMDDNFNISYEDLEDVQLSFDNPFFTEIIVEGESLQFDFQDNSCDTVITYEVFIFDTPGQIVSNTGSACDEVLSVEFDFGIFPDFMDEDQLEYTWTSNQTGFLSEEPTVSVNMDGTYSVNLFYELPSGEECNFTLSQDIVVTGSPPAAPTFNLAPTQTCPENLTGLIYQVPQAAGATYDWNVTNGTITTDNENEIIVSVTDPALPMVVSVFAQSSCDDSPPQEVTLNVTPAPEVVLAMAGDVCINTMTTITSNLVSGVADKYLWSINDPDATWTMTGSTTQPSLSIAWSTAGVKTFTLAVEDAGGCVSDEVSGTINVVDPLVPPTASCGLINSNSVTFDFEDAVLGEGTEFIVVSGQTGTQNGNSYTVDNLVPGDIVTLQFTTLGTNHPCGNSLPFTLDCIASNCSLTPSIDPVDDICLDGTELPIQLEENSSSEGEWLGAGVDVDGMFDPSLVGAGTHTITFNAYDPVADCYKETSTDITIFDLPGEMFTVSKDSVCTGEEFFIDFPNTVGITYEWLYDSGNSTPDESNTGFGISFDETGDKFIRMTAISAPGCEEEFLFDIYVRPDLEFAPVQCGDSSPTSVSFGWDPVDGVTQYDYTILVNGIELETGSQDQLDYEVTGLNQGDVVEIEVTAIDPNGCINPISGINCVANDCPTFDVDVQASSTIECWDPLNGISIDLTQMVTDMDGNMAVGTGEWVGTDVDPLTGIFTPSGPDNYSLSFTFIEDVTGCTGLGSIDILIADSPTSDFTVSNDNLCILEELTITVDIYDQGIDYDWSGTTIDAGLYNITDNQDGTFTVEFFGAATGDFVLVTQIGDCISDPTSQTVNVEEVPTMPVISCGETDLSFVTFVWDQVDCAEEYNISIGGIFVETISETMYLVENLEENEIVDIEVEVISRCLCDFPMILSQSCAAQACDMAMLEFDPTIALEYCLSEVPAAFTFDVSPIGTGIQNNGTFTWTGEGVNASGLVDLSGLDSGTYPMNVEYEEAGCFYNNSVSFTIYEVPTVDITTEDIPCYDIINGSVNLTVNGNGPFEIIVDGSGGTNEINGMSVINGNNALPYGDYDLTITDANGCVHNDFFIILGAPEPVDFLEGPASLGVDSMGVFTYSTDVANMNSLTWLVDGTALLEIDCSNPSDCNSFDFTGVTGGSHEICAIANYGDNCEVIECRDVIINEFSISNVYIPNVFSTMNQGPENSVLKMYVFGDDVTVLSIAVFDRWGNRVYLNEESFEVAGGSSATLWDGMFQQGNEFLEGVYIYHIEVDNQGVVEYKTDDVTIIN